MTIEQIQHNFYPFGILLLIIFISFWKKNKFYCKVYLLFTVMSIALTIVASIPFHYHFFKWGVGYFDYRTNIYFSSYILNSYLSRKSDLDFIQSLADSFELKHINHEPLYRYGKLNGNYGVRSSYIHDVKITKHDNLLFSYHQDMPSGIETQELIVHTERDGYNIFLKTNQITENWIESYRGYVVAMLRGEVFYAKPHRKYTDFFLFNIVLFLLLTVVFWHRRFKAGVNEIEKIEKLILGK